MEKLLDLPKADFPNFKLVTTSQIATTVDTMLRRLHEIIFTLLESNEEPTWQNFMSPIDEIDDYFSQIWSAVSHIHSVVCDDEFHEAYEESLLKITDFYSDLSRNEKYYQKIKQLSESTEYSDYSDAQKKIIQNALIDFRLAGVHLDKEVKTKLSDISRKLAVAQNKFEKNILDATYGFSHQVSDINEVSGIPENFIDAAKQLAEKNNFQGLEFGLDAPTFITIMSYAKSRDLRKTMYQAYVTRASEQGPGAGKWDNSNNMVTILQLRQEKAKVLGFKNFAELSLEKKMADNPQQVMQFLHDLAKKSMPQAQKEYKELQQFAYELDGITLEPWDLGYYSEMMKQKKYSYSSLQYKPYFPFQNVINGLFDVVSRLFGLKIKEVEAAIVWHKDVKLYAVNDKNDDIRGYFYIDLYAREKKRGGAWMDDCRTRRITANGSLQTPIAFLTCNFSPALGDEPALLTHDDVVTLFHEFGHTLHHILTKVDFSDVSGIAGVKWDAVELPSQFLENWAYSPECLEFLGKHYKTGATLPEDMVSQLLLSKNFHSAMQMMRQLEFAIFDMNIYSNPSIESEVTIQKTLDDVRAECAVTKIWPNNRFQHSFSHIFGGGYSAGYYSYKWAEVMSADAFTLFEEKGVFNQEIGSSFCSNILEKGGVYEPGELFFNFRGRDPQIDSLLQHSNINVSET